MTTTIGQELRRLPFLTPLFVVLTGFILASYFSKPLLLVTQDTYTKHIITTHRFYQDKALNGGQLQRRLVPELAQGVESLIEHSSVLQRLIQSVYGRDHQIPPIVPAYWFVHLVFGTLGLLGVYFFGRIHLKISPLSALGMTFLFQAYEAYCLSGFVTGRWTDVSVPALMIWCFIFLLSQSWVGYLIVFSTLCVVREAAMYLLPLIGLLWIWKAPGFDFKTAARWMGSSLVLLLVIRGLLIYFYPGARFSDESSSMLESLWISLKNNLHDSNMIKVPLAMQNILWFLAFVGWKEKSPEIRAIVCLGMLIFVLQLMMGSEGEGWGRDLPVMLCFVLSAWTWIDHRIERLQWHS